MNEHKIYQFLNWKQNWISLTCWETLNQWWYVIAHSLMTLQWYSNSRIKYSSVGDMANDNYKFSYGYLEKNMTGIFYFQRYLTRMIMCLLYNGLFKGPSHYQTKNSLLISFIEQLFTINRYFCSTGK